MQMEQLVLKHEALLADFKELRKDFDAIVECLEGQNILVGKHLCRQRAVRGKVSLESALQHETATTHVFAAAGQVAWSAFRRASKKSNKAATAVQREKLVVVGGMEHHSPKSFMACPRSLEVFDVHSGKWEAPERMSSPRVCCGAAVLGGNLYVCGGFAPMGQSVLCYNPIKTKPWTHMPKLNHSHSCCAALADDRHLYVLGGQDGSQVLDSVERINPSNKDKGFELVLPGMCQCRNNFAAVVMQRRIYITGGCNTSRPEIMDSKVARSAEVLSLGTGASTPLPDMIVPRYSHAATVAEDKVVVSGGGVPGFQQSLNSVEVYAPLVGHWVLCPQMDMPETRGAHLMLVAAGKLYVIGGSCEDKPSCPAQQSMQCLDVKALTWEKQPPMQFPRMCCCGTVIKTGPGALE